MEVVPIVVPIIKIVPNNVHMIGMSLSMTSGKQMAATYVTAISLV